ncbi:MAG: hypothetical protein JW893_08745 [Candidatus Omnitrophica bacterium]|nr:hypothetical protein [Candidatus Omnitrophota bacterium]
MILGVDHLALSSNHILSAGLRNLQDQGYCVKFVQDELTNSETKKPFLSCYQPIHSVAYCQTDRGVSLELTGHDAPLKDRPSWYQILMESAPDGTKPFAGDLPCSSKDWEVTVGCKGALAGLWDPFHAQLWYLPSPITKKQEKVVKNATVRAVLVPVVDLERSNTFWEKGIGVRRINDGHVDGRGWVHLAWKSLIPRWSLEIILFETESKSVPLCLDDSGFTCIAFLSNNIIQDRARLLEYGALEASESSEHLINKKRLWITIARGPSGELIELIEFEKENARELGGGRN